ncbi:MAG: menaquinone biosynthesis decarboxylase [Bacteroidales bacterium]|nr:menaquinone biosynthesis decarboxylase [Bacteroidales bacterium]
MAYNSLSEFIAALDRNGELHRVKEFVNPVLEITEITERVARNGGKALLFENNGTQFPVLTNAFGSDKRMELALGHDISRDAAGIISKLSERISGIRPKRTLKALSDLLKIASYMPVRSSKKGLCQQVIHLNPDLGILPVLKCRPFDGGRFLTLPLVHTVHPDSGAVNLGMYRMQIIDKQTTAMHWQRHKTGASHFEAWEKTGKKMPVAVALGGDPVYTYAATAPLPENVNEYILAGIIRRKRVKLVKCLTNDLYVPYDCDIVIEGYVDPSEEMIMEGPFGDHTGFYSLPDLYPLFHVTCITHARKAVYPATVVGIPPQEDAWFAKITEKLFLMPIKTLLLPEIEDLHMPPAGVAHNLAVVRIKKSYPGQGMKVINSLFGAGQMMFTKYLIVVSGDIDIRDYRKLSKYVLENTDFRNHILFTRGPLDALDHSSGSDSFGGKAGIDATLKLPEETSETYGKFHETEMQDKESFETEDSVLIIKDFLSYGIPVAFITLNISGRFADINEVVHLVMKGNYHNRYRLILIVDKNVDTEDAFMVAWQVLGNSDPLRDHAFAGPSCLIIDGRIKAELFRYSERNWPEIVCSDPATIKAVDEKWHSLGFRDFIESPSLKFSKLARGNSAKVDISASA